MALIDTDYFRSLPLGQKAVEQLPIENLAEFIQTASDYIEDYLDQKIQLHTTIERKLGNREYVMILDDYPIQSLVNVGFDGYTGDVGTHATSDFLIHSASGMIEWIDKMYVFRGDRVYTIEYTAGYDEVPSPIKMATALQTVQLLRPMYGGTQSDSPVGTPFADEQIVSLLERYRRKRLS
jgi:hypothetical protein